MLYFRNKKNYTWIMNPFLEDFHKKRVFVSIEYIINNSYLTYVVCKWMVRILRYNVPNNNLNNMIKCHLDIIVGNTF